MVIDIDLAIESIGESFDLDFAGSAVLFGSGQLVGQPEHARPEAGCPAGMAARGIVLARAPGGIDAALGGVIRVAIGKSDEVAVDGFDRGCDGLGEVELD